MTGGASLVGCFIRIRVAADDARAVVIGDLVVTPREGRPPEAVKAAGAEFRVAQTDVFKQDNIAVPLAAVEEFGGVTVMACNAGIGGHGGETEPAGEGPRRLRALHRDGADFAARAVGPCMRERRRAGSVPPILRRGRLRGSALSAVYSSVNAVGPDITASAQVAQTSNMSAAAPMRQPPRGPPREIGCVMARLGAEFSGDVRGGAVPVDGWRTAAS